MCCREGTDGALGTAIDCATDSELSYKRVETVSYRIFQVQMDVYLHNLLIINKIKECLVERFLDRTDARCFVAQLGRNSAVLERLRRGSFRESSSLTAILVDTPGSVPAGW